MQKYMKKITEGNKTTFLVIFDSIVIACDVLKAQNSSILLPLYHTDVAFALLLVEDQF